MITAVIEKYKLIIKKKEKKHEKVVLLAKSKLKKVEVLIFKALINLYMTHEEFISINNVLKEYH